MTESRAIRGGAELQLQAVTRAYGPFEAVSNLSLTIISGEFLTLLGASGSGKTTTLNLLAGFDQPSSGRVLLDGQDVTPVPPHRRNLGVVFQNYALFPHMTVFQNIAFPLKMHRVPRDEVAKKVEWALSLVRLPGFQERKPDMLSGGQQQRVALARALVFSPSALLMDEPLAALDRALREQIQEELREIHAGLKTTIVYVTHDQEEAMRLSDRIAVMRAGSIEQLDRPRTLYDAPKSLYVATFMGKSNLLRGVITRHEDGVTVVSDHGASYRVRYEPGFPLGTPVTIAVRPERVVFATGGRSSVNRTSGKVEKLTYLGGDVQWEVSAWSTRLLLRTSSRESPPDLRPGNMVEIGWGETDAAGVYPDDQASAVLVSGGTA